MVSLLTPLLLEPSSPLWKPSKTLHSVSPLVPSQHHQLTVFRLNQGFSPCRSTAKFPSLNTMYALIALLTFPLSIISVPPPPHLIVIFVCVTEFKTFSNRSTAQTSSQCYSLFLLLYPLGLLHK